MEIIIVVLSVLVAAGVPTCLWLREELRFWCKHSNEWRNLALATINEWKRFKYRILLDGHPVAEFTNVSLARIVLTILQRNEEVNERAEHKWTLEGE